MVGCDDHPHTPGSQDAIDTVFSREDLALFNGCAHDMPPGRVRSVDVANLVNRRSIGLGGASTDGPKAVISTTWRIDAPLWRASGAVNRQSMPFVSAF
jgi:hypothetical protein